MERCPVSIVITDNEAKIQFVNAACVDVTGYAADELIGENPRILQSGEMSAAVYQDMWNTISSGAEWRGRFHNRKKSGEMYWEAVKIIPIKNEKGQITNYLAIKEDITRRLERERELVHAVKMEAAGQLSGGVAHDFNNLLTIISGNLQLLDDYIDSSDTELKGIIEDARSASADGIALIRRLLAFSRKKPLQPEQHNINVLIVQSGRLLHRMLGEGVNFVVEESAETINALVDLAQFESALINLCANSQDAMNGHGTIVIRAERQVLTWKHIRRVGLWPGSYVVVSVSDDGPGMVAEIAAHACEPFFTTKGVGKGSGLGLSMVSLFVTESGGALKIETTPGCGATVLMYFPESDSAGNPVEPAEAELHLIGGSETILVVEDNELVRKFAERSLKSLGYVVLNTVDASKAIDILKTNKKIDLLFTDIVMPGEIDGRALAKWASERQPGLKVMLTTGGDQGPLDAASDEVGAFPLIKKPYSKPELANTIRAVLDYV